MGNQRTNDEIKWNVALAMVGIPRGTFSNDISNKKFNLEDYIHVMFVLWML